MLQEVVLVDFVSYLIGCLVLKLHTHVNQVLIRLYVEWMSQSAGVHIKWAIATFVAGCLLLCGFPTSTSLFMSLPMLILFVCHPSDTRVHCCGTNGALFSECASTECSLMLSGVCIVRMHSMTVTWSSTFPSYGTNQFIPSSSTRTESFCQCLPS